MKTRQKAPVQTRFCTPTYSKWQGNTRGSGHLSAVAKEKRGIRLYLCHPCMKRRDSIRGSIPHLNTHTARQRGMQVPGPFANNCENGKEQGFRH
jgi:hypothetical protein